MTLGDLRGLSWRKGTSRERTYMGYLQWQHLFDYVSDLEERMDSLICPHCLVQIDVCCHV